MNPLSLAQLVYFVFAAFVILGGMMGFVKAGSKASLIAGSISGLFLILSGVLLSLFGARPLIGLGLGAFTTLMLLGRFLPAFLRTKKIMPAGLIVLFGIISLVVTVLAVAKL